MSSAQSSGVNSSETCQPDEYEGIEVREALPGESSSDDEETCSSGIVFVPGRVFLVHEVARAAGGHRPYLLLIGCFADVSFGTNGHYALHTVEPPELQLSLRYEPPSPKFSRSCPGGVSYRLKLLQGSQFLYLLRGLPKELCQDLAAQALSWGPLKVMFQHPGDLGRVISVLRHVEVLDRPLWPPPAALTDGAAALLTDGADQIPAATTAHNGNGTASKQQGWSRFSLSHLSTERALLLAGSLAVLACLCYGVLSARSRGRTA